MKRRIVSVFLCLILVVAMVAGCGKKQEAKPADEKKTSKSVEGKETVFTKAMADLENSLAPLPKKDSGKKLAAIESTLSNSFWVVMKEGYEDGAKEYGVSIDIQAAESDTDTAGQLDILHTMLVKNYDAIAVSPLTGDCLISGIVEANKAGVKIITTGNEVDEKALKAAKGAIDSKITIDFHKQGVLSAEYVINKQKKGKVAIIAGNEGGTQADARRDGAKEAFEKAGMDIVAIEQCDFDVQKAYDATIAIVEANPDLVGITCGNDDMALGVIRALEEKKIKDKVTVVGVDFTEEAKEAIKAGSYDASVAMSPYMMGKEAVIIMLKALEGQDVSSVGDQTPMAVVDASNVNEMEDWK